MAITLLCPNLKCRAVLQVPEKSRGKRVRCGQCQTAFLVPPKKDGSQTPGSNGVPAEAAPEA
jgi:LSD1 subclass zinc finger protein